MSNLLVWTILSTGFSGWYCQQNFAVFIEQYMSPSNKIAEQVDSVAEGWFIHPPFQLALLNIKHYQMNKKMSPLDKVVQDGGVGWFICPPAHSAHPKDYTDWTTKNTTREQKPQGRIRKNILSLRCTRSWESKFLLLRKKWLFLIGNWGGGGSLTR